VLGASLPVLAFHASHVVSHLHHRFHGPRVDYLALGAAAFVSWIGLTGPGEAALVAAGIAAARGRVDIVEVIAVAWVAAMVGGSAGWLIGLRGGRALMTRPGPLHALRLRLLAHGDEIFARRGWWLAVYLTPSWMAGVSAMRARRFLLANAGASLIWALAFGLGSYVAGPSISDAVGDLGTVGLVLLVAFVSVSALIRSRRRGLRH
jgi:membrane protein DedA with SNARE-associated domain